MCALLTRAAFLVIARVRIDDAEVRPTPRGAIIAINHRGMLDFFVGTIAFRKRLHPTVLGVALRLVGAIPAGRGRGAAVTFRLARDVLRRGGVIAITPEGRVVAPAERPAGLGKLKGGVGLMSSGPDRMEVVSPPITTRARGWEMKTLPPMGAAAQASWRETLLCR